MGLNDYIGIKEELKVDSRNLLLHKDLPVMYPFNKELLLSGNKIMVHSLFAKNAIIRTGYIKEDKVKCINMVEQIEDDAHLIKREILFNKFGIPTDAIIIASFGYIQITKLNYEVCEAVKNIQRKVEKKICYVMVGEGDYADEELESGKIVKTGFVTLNEFNSMMKYSDIIVNLRNPSMGETSAAMLRTLQLGKPCITNNGGWFSEVPDSCVYKVNLDGIIENLENALCILIDNQDKRVELGKSAQEFSKKAFSKDIIVGQIYDFISN